MLTLLYPWTCSVRWCLAEGLASGDQCQCTRSDSALKVCLHRCATQSKVYLTLLSAACLHAWPLSLCNITVAIVEERNCLGERRIPSRWITSIHRDTWWHGSRNHNIVTAIKSGPQLCFLEKAAVAPSRGSISGANFYMVFDSSDGSTFLVFEICPHHGQWSMNGPTSTTDGP